MNNQRVYLGALICLGVLYFMMGFVTVLNDTLVPYFKQGFHLNYAQSSLVQFYFYLTYGFVSIPAGKMLMRIGYKKGMIIGFLLASVGAMLFFPSAMLHEYHLFLCALFVVAIGIVLLQVSANPYITVLGTPETAAARLTLIQGIGSLGTTLAPLFGAHFILSKIEGAVDSSQALVIPYLMIAFVLLLIALVIWKLRLPDAQIDGGRIKLSLVDTLQRYPRLRFGVLALFLYVGAEVAIGTFLTNYTADRLGMSESSANYFVSYYWGGMLIGRLAGACYLRYVKVAKLLMVLSGLAFVAVLFSIATAGLWSVLLLVFCGFCNSVMFASIFSLSIEGMGENTGQASGILSTAITGGAILTYAQGSLKDGLGWEVAFIIPALCYLGIFIYARFAYKFLSK
ncbi:MAG: sugar MFS transporter [Sphingobacterium sp.]|jgi:FHS family L-fucose permease-like MFS transporter|nr:sugar MFS transporter [Sphingobacterium sp.]